MAQKITVLLTDDIDGGEASQTVRFGLDGASYELDLSDANAASLRDALAPYVTAGRRTGSQARRQARPQGRVTSTDYDPKAVRAWAASHKVEVPVRGRIPSAVIEQYRAAGN